MHQTTTDAQMIYAFQERTQVPSDSTSGHEFVDLVQWHCNDHGQGHMGTKQAEIRPR